MSLPGFNPLQAAIMGQQPQQQQMMPGAGTFDPLQQGGLAGGSPTPGIAGIVNDAPAQVVLPDTLADSLANANKHLIAMARGLEPMDEDSLAPQLQTFMALLQKIHGMRDQSGGTGGGYGAGGY